MLRSTCAFLALTAPAFADAPRVAVDIPPVHSLVAQVMDGVGTPDLVIPPGLSPHDVALRPSDAAALERADLVVWVGSELSPAVTRTIEALSGGEVLTLLDVPGARVLEFREGPVFQDVGEGHDHGDHDAHGDEDQDEHGHDEEHGDHDEHGHDEEHDDHDEHGHDEEHGDHDEHGHDEEHGDAHDHDHDGRDPHAWLDPANAIVWIEAIRQALTEIDPENSDVYATNAAASVAELTALQGEIEARIAPLRGQSFVVFHDAYHYFEARFDIEASGTISIGDGQAPGPRRLVEIGEAVQEMNITCVFAEPQFNRNLVEATVSDAGARVGVIDPLGVDLEPGPDLYADLLNGMALSFESCLAPQ